MRAYIVTTFIGCFGVSEENKIIVFKQFPKNPEEIAEKLKLSEYELLDEEKLIQNDLWKKKYKEFVYGVRKPEVKHLEPNNKAEHFIRDNLRKLAVDYKFVKDQIEFNQLLAKINIELTKVKIKKSIERDRLIIQANGSIEELDKATNIFVERLREWYSLHFPEMDRTIESHEKFAKIIEKFGSREKIDEPELNQLKENSMGTDFTEEDIKNVQSFAMQVISLFEFKKHLSKYLDSLLKEIAPNFSELAGPMLAAKLIAKAGGLEKLARMPSSTVQLLGSEKALFRYLHGKGKSPRFGLLFNHQLIQNTPEKFKGRVARVLASKLSIAAKMDYYSKEYKGDKLKKDLEERVKEILSSKE